MKKFYMLFFCLLFLLGLSGCKKDSNQPVVRVYNWGEYISQEALDKFEEETGIRVIYETYASNEDLYVKLSAGTESYDVVVPSDYLIERCIKEGLVQKIDKEKIPNRKNIFPNLLNQAFDPKDAYSVPYFWGTLGIIYNKAAIKDTIDSWDDLWNPKYKGDIVMYDSQRDSIAIALKRLGYSMNTTNLQELEEAKVSLIKQKPLVYAYLADEARDIMVQEDAYLCAMYSGDALLMMEQNKNLDYVLPKEGTNLFMDSFMIPKSASHVDEAHAFINFMCRPDIAKLNVEEVRGYSTPIKGAYEQLEDALKTSDVAYPDFSKAPELEVYRDASALNEVYYDLWAQVQGTY